MLRLMTGKWHQIGRVDVLVLVRRRVATWTMVMILKDAVEGGVAIGKT